MDSDVEYKKVSKKISLENVCIQIENKKNNNANGVSIGNLTGTNNLNQAGSNGFLDLNGRLTPNLPTTVNSSSQLDLVTPLNCNLPKSNDSNLLNVSSGDTSTKTDRKIVIIDDRNSKQIKIKLNQTENSNFLNNSNNSCLNTLSPGLLLIFFIILNFIINLKYTN